jgi:hypothetical protein
VRYLTGLLRGGDGNKGVFINTLRTHRFQARELAPRLTNRSERPRLSLDRQGLPHPCRAEILDGMRCTKSDTLIQVPSLVGPVVFGAIIWCSGLSPLWPQPDVGGLGLRDVPGAFPRALIAVHAKLFGQFAPLLRNAQQHLLHLDVSSFACSLFAFASSCLIPFRG